MKERCVITVWPQGRELTATVGDSLYTLLLVAGLIEAGDAEGERLRLERGSISPSSDAAAEAAIFTPSQLTEGWLLASCRKISGDAELMLGRLVDATLPRPLGQGYGLVIDVGTATISCGLAGLDSMRIPMVSACGNSQLRLAADIEQRMALFQREAAIANQLKSMLRADVTRMTERLIHYTGISPQRITTLTVVGRRPLLHMLLDLPPQQDGRVAETQLYPAARLNLPLLPPQAQAWFLPLSQHELGSDTVSAILAAGLLERVEADGVSIVIDVGVSCEIIAAGRGRLLACSVPTAPFEGLKVSCGMQATSGAIYAVEIEDEVSLRTIHDEPPRGLCGAGLIAAVDQLVQQEIVNADGRLLQPDDLPPQLARRFRGTAAGLEFMLAPAVGGGREVSLNQADILQLQLAKGSLRAACQAVLAALGAGERDIVSIMLAEAYRANINPEAALSLGLLPPIEAQRVRSIGNAGWQGAYLALTDRENLSRAERIAQLLQRLDLSNDHNYAAAFINAMSFAY